MEIGKKLKENRLQSKMTQEQVAEQLLVSRQTISNWENERSYPDIISVIRLSDLYGVSLDELLKGDAKMIEHLDESTNVVKSNQKILRAIGLNIVLFLLFLLIACFAPNSVYVIACVFCLAVVSSSYLLYQIIQRI